jgi:cap1 methyltransferase
MKKNMKFIFTGGHFICKLFDVFTPFSVGLVYIMRFCFENVSLLKPITSRPANSERYLIGKWRKANVTPVLEYLRDCHAQMWDWSCNKQNKDILEIVPLEILKCGGNDDQFFQYIKRHNDE